MIFYICMIWTPFLTSYDHEISILVNACLAPKQLRLLAKHKVGNFYTIETSRLDNYCGVFQCHTRNFKQQPFWKKTGDWQYTFHICLCNAPLILHWLVTYSWKLYNSIRITPQTGKVWIAWLCKYLSNLSP